MRLRRSFDTFEKYGLWLVAVLVVAGLHATTFYNYLVFHTIVEVFAIVVACGIFMLAWNSRTISGNNYLLFLGIAYLFVGAIDLMHTLAYEGIGIFPGRGTNLPTQLWIGARSLESLALVLAPLLAHKRLRAGLVFAAFGLVTALVLVSILAWRIFPVCFDAGGLTLFKKTSEYLISALLIAAVVLLLRKRAEFDRDVLRMLVASILLTIASELSFTLYRDAYDIANEVGHLLKLASFYLIYRAVIQTGIRQPYSMLLRDVKESNDRLRRKRDIVRSYLDTAGVLIAVVDKHENISLINRKGCEILGYREDEIVGRNWFDTCLAPESRERARVAFAHLMAGQTTPARSGENPIRTRDGAERSMIWSNSVLKDESGQIVAVLNSGTDITERERMEKEREHLVGILESKNRELERFTSIVRHDLGNPLFAIGAFAKSISNYCGQASKAIEKGHLDRKRHDEILSALTEDVLRSVDSIEASVVLMKNLLEGLRQVAAVGRLPLHKAPVDMDRMLTRIIENMRSKITACGASVTVGELPACLGDAVQLHEVFGNLLDNAIKYLDPHRKAEIRVSGRCEDGMSLYCVEDNGIGIAAEQQERVFEIFHRVNPDGAVGGEGLGLSIVQRLVERHSGRIWLESDPGQGSRFFVALPGVPALDLSARRSRRRRHDTRQERRVDRPGM